MALAFFGLLFIQLVFSTSVEAGKVDCESDQKEAIKRCLRDTLVDHLQKQCPKEFKHRKEKLFEKLVEHYAGSPDFHTACGVSEEELKRKCPEPEEGKTYQDKRKCKNLVEKCLEKDFWRPSYPGEKTGFAEFGNIVRNQFSSEKGKDCTNTIKLVPISKNNFQDHCPKAFEVSEAQKAQCLELQKEPEEAQVPAPSEPKKVVQKIVQEEKKATGVYDECDTKLKEELSNILKADKEGILALQFKLTTLKLAKRSIKDGHTTLEGYIRKDMQRLAALEKANPEPKKKLEALYDDHVIKDVEKAFEHIEKMKGKAKGANYWKAQKRFMNEDVSAYLLHEKMTNENSDLEKMDIAITWYMQKISNEAAIENGEFSAKHNLTNLTNQLARYTGDIKGAKKAKEEKLDSEIALLETAIKKFMDNGLEKVENNLAGCFAENGNWKGVCKMNSDFLNKELSDLLFTLDEADKAIGQQTADLVLKQTRKDHVEPLIEPPSDKKPASVSQTDPPAEVKEEQVSKKQTTTSAPGPYLKNPFVVVQDNTFVSPFQRFFQLNPTEQAKVSFEECEEGIKKYGDCKSRINNHVKDWFKDIYEKHSDTYFFSCADYADDFEEEVVINGCSVKLKWEFGYAGGGKFSTTYQKGAYSSQSRDTTFSAIKGGDDCKFKRILSDGSPANRDAISAEVLQCLREKGE